MTDLETISRDQKLIKRALGILLHRSGPPRDQYGHETEMQEWEKLLLDLSE